MITLITVYYSGDGDNDDKDDTTATELKPAFDDVKKMKIVLTIDDGNTEDNDDDDDDNEWRLPQGI